MARCCHVRNCVVLDIKFFKHKQRYNFLALAIIFIVIYKCNRIFCLITQTGAAC